jgi:hypothetical protein
MVYPSLYVGLDSIITLRRLAQHHHLIRVHLSMVYPPTNPGRTSRTSASTSATAAITIIVITIVERVNADAILRLYRESLLRCLEHLTNIFTYVTTLTDILQSANAVVESIPAGCSCPVDLH